MFCFVFFSMVCGGLNVPFTDGFDFSASTDCIMEGGSIRLDLH